MCGTYLSPDIAPYYKPATLPAVLALQALVDDFLMLIDYRAYIAFLHDNQALSPNADCIDPQYLLA